MKEKLVYLSKRNLNNIQLYKILKQDPELNQVDEYEAVKYYNELPCSVVTIFEKNYPKRLKLMHNPPWILFYLGDIQIANDKIVLITGTNFPSEYGKKATRDLINSQQIQSCVLSGFMYGIDTIVHRELINNKQKGIAVLASGFNNIYPVKNEFLINKIAINGLVISPFSLEFKADVHSFAFRNQIMAALAEEIYIIEAKNDSYPLHIVDYAINYGTEIYALPGSIYNENSQGPNLLISEGANVIYLK